METYGGKILLRKGSIVGAVNMIVSEFTLFSQHYAYTPIYYDRAACIMVCEPRVL